MSGKTAPATRSKPRLKSAPGSTPRTKNTSPLPGTKSAKAELYPPLTPMNAPIITANAGSTASPTPQTCIIVLENYPSKTSLRAGASLPTIQLQQKPFVYRQFKNQKKIPFLKETAAQ